MNYTNMMMTHSDMANILAEDAGAPELRNPLAGGMQGKLLPRLRKIFSRKAGK